jgi:hypothetical protein
LKTNNCLNNNRATIEKNDLQTTIENNNSNNNENLNVDEPSTTSSSSSNNKEPTVIYIFISRLLNLTTTENKNYR